MKHYLIVVFIMTLSFSCQRNLNEIVRKELIVRNSKAKFQNLYNEYSTSVDALLALRKYSDNLIELVFLLRNIKSNKKLIRMIRKALLGSKNLSLLCSEYIFPRNFKLKVEESCIEGYFNICPRSFLILNDLEKSFLNMFKIVLGHDNFNKSDCFNLLLERE